MVIATVYKRLIQIGKVSGAVSFLFAVPYALAQYIQAKDASRVEQTLNLFKMYNAAPFAGYREKLTKALTRNKEAIAGASVDSAAFGELQFKLLKQDDIETEVLMLFDFFEGVSVCVKSGLCDKSTAIKLFKPRANDIYINFYQYMITQRGKTTSPDFGSGVESLARAEDRS
jgi:hypothetical protein